MREHLISDQDLMFVDCFCSLSCKRSTNTVKLHMDVDVDEQFAAPELVTYVIKSNRFEISRRYEIKAVVGQVQ